MASFFNNQDHAGLALLIFAVLSIIAGIVTIILEIVDGDDISIGNIIAAVGNILAGFLYLGFAKKVKSGAINDKFDIVVEFVHVFAFATILEGIFGLVADVVSGIINIIFGFICIWAYKKITDGKDSLMDKIIWIILLVVFVFTILAGLIMFVGIITIPLGIATVIIGVFMVMSLVDNDVKAKFGM